MFLKGMKCAICGDCVSIIPHEGFVSHGECNTCGKVVVLPEEKYIDFCHQHGTSSRDDALEGIGC